MTGISFILVFIMGMVTGITIISLYHIGRL